jgi:formiminotetrahydrofolate cyclodeaminase
LPSGGIGATLIDMKSPVTNADEAPPMAERTLGELTAAIASDAVAPGSGSAAAVGLALAAACAAKAVAITLKRRPSDSTLSELWGTLAVFAERALAAGGEDAIRFERFMHDQNRAMAASLIDHGERLQRSALTLKSVLERLATQVDSVVLADIRAAQALCDACLAIQSQNLSSNQAAAAAESQ